VLGPASKKGSLAGDMMVDGVFPPLLKVALLLHSRPLILSGLATRKRALSGWPREHRGSRPRLIIDELLPLFGPRYSCANENLSASSSSYEAALSSEGAARASSPSSLMAWWALRISLRATARHARLDPSRSEDST
jgi:hypothetical protein